jgi:murein DD-endopeptidase MepM/ murein hydrolase activator NlpD
MAGPNDDLRRARARAIAKQSQNQGQGQGQEQQATREKTTSSTGRASAARPVLPRSRPSFREVSPWKPGQDPFGFDEGGNYIGASQRDVEDFLGWEAARRLPRSQPSYRHVGADRPARRVPAPPSAAPASTSVTAVAAPSAADKQDDTHRVARDYGGLPRSQPSHRGSYRSATTQAQRDPAQQQVSPVQSSGYAEDDEAQAGQLISEGDYTEAETRQTGTVAADPGLEAWREAYAAEHGYRPGEGNDETEAEALANKLWSEKFVERTGQAPTQDDWEDHYYRHQTRGSDSFQYYLSQAQEALDNERRARTAPTTQDAEASYLDADGRPRAAMQAQPSTGATTTASVSPSTSAAPITGARPRYDDPNISSGGSFGRSSTIPRVPAPPAGEVWQRPYQGDYAMTQAFGANPEQYKRFGIKGNAGVDYAVPDGTPVQAAASGVVKKVDYDPTGWGYSVEVEHADGSTTKYSHLTPDSAKVKPGQAVRQGETLALSGHSGNVRSSHGGNGAHLDFAYRPASGAPEGYAGYADSSQLFGRPVGGSTSTAPTAGATGARTVPAPPTTRPAATPAYTDYPSKNYDDRPKGATPDSIVLHATAGGLKPSLAHLSNPESKVSAHYVIGKDGKVYRMVPDDKRAWHAGVGDYNGRQDWNDSSIGIEIENANDGRDEYTPQQRAALAALMRDLQRRYNIQRGNVVTHSQVAYPRERKSDPQGLDVQALLNEIYGQ